MQPDPPHIVMPMAHLRLDIDEPTVRSRAQGVRANAASADKVDSLLRLAVFDNERAVRQGGPDNLLNSPFIRSKLLEEHVVDWAQRTNRSSDLAAVVSQSSTSHQSPPDDVRR